MNGPLALVLMAGLAGDPRTAPPRPPVPSAAVPARPATENAARARLGEPDGPPRERWVGADKVKHFFLAGFAECVGYAVVRAAGGGRNEALAGGIAVASVASIGREVYGARTGGTFSVPDLVWDAAGIAAHGVLLARVGR